MNLSVCQQVFCAEAVLGLLSQNFVTWGWDLTYSSNKQRLLDMISRHFGSVASATIRNFSIEKLPLVILVAKLKGNMEIIQVSPHFTLDENIMEVTVAQFSGHPWKCHPG